MQQHKATCWSLPEKGSTTYWSSVRRGGRRSITGRRLLVLSGAEEKSQVGRWGGGGVTFNKWDDANVSCGEG